MMDTRKYDDPWDEIADLKAKISQIERFPSLSKNQGKCLELLDKAGMGVDSDATGNCLVDMVEEICKKYSAQKQVIERLNKQGN